MAGSDADAWERERGRLHHGVFHPQFYHFIKGYEDELVAALIAGTAPSSTLTKVLAGWPGIAREHSQHFDHAPAVAIATPETLLATLAITATTRPGFPAELASQVRAKAEALTAANAADNCARIKLALDEPKDLLCKLDVALLLFASPRNAVDETLAKAQVRTVLDLCRRFSDAVSAIPGKLRGGLDER